MKQMIALLLAAVIACSVLTAAVAADTATKEYLYGDADLDGTVNASDALLILKASVGKVELDEIPAKAADVNVDQAINASDALQVLQFTVGKLPAFKAGKSFTVGTPEPEPSLPNPVSEPVVSSEPSQPSVPSEPSEPDQPSQPDQLFNLSLSYNGAYEQDETADTTFVMDNTGLEPEKVYVINATVFKDDVDKKRLVVSLQGLINRDFGMDENHRTFVYVVSDTSDSSWLSQLLADGVFKGFTKRTVNSWDLFLSYFENQLKYCGMILWDPDVWATANVAATICGLDGYLPVLSDSAVENHLSDMGVEVKQTLVNMFASGKSNRKITGTTIQSTGSAKNDAYRWALEKYFDRCSAKYVAYTLDGAATIPDTGFTHASNCLTNHDYLIARRAFFFDLDPVTSESACDDRMQTVGLDAETMRLIFQRRYDRAQGAMGMAMGFPPWWAKYTTGHGGFLSDNQLEPYYAEVVTCYNLAMEADAAQPAEMTNGSAYYKYVPLVEKYENTKPAQMLTYDPGVHYFTVYVGDYDSSAWMKKYVYEMWIKRDAKRGKVDLMWSYNPNLSYRIPMAFDYIYKNATAHDYFAAGDSGAGYVIPSAFYPDTLLHTTGTTRPVSTGNGADEWVRYCKEFYERFDIDITGFIINNGRFDTPVMDMYNQISPVGSLYYNGNDERLLLRNGVPYVQCRIGVGKDNPAYMYDWGFNQMHSRNSSQSFNFAAYRTVKWTPSEIYNNVNGYIEYAAGQGQTVQYVDPYNFFHLIRQSGQGVVVND